MFVKKLIIASPTQIIRDIEFKSGLNLIIDNTPTEDNSKATGNNVGKTTVLKLIDFCLGAKDSIIYTDTENKKETYDTVKDYLIENEITITLVLVENIVDPNAKQIEIQRNFLSGKKNIRTINGEPIPNKDYESELEKYIMPTVDVEKPSFRQIISHNIRYKDASINATLRTLSSYTTNIEYETLYLYLLGCKFNDGYEKQELLLKKKQEVAFKDRLQQKQTKNKYEIALNVVESEIVSLNKKKDSFNLNESLEEDLASLNSIKYQINRISSKISRLEIRKNLIEESVEELNKSTFQTDLQQIKIIYNQAVNNISGIQKTFEDLVAYHNKMVVEKVKFISQDLPGIISELESSNTELSELLGKEKELSQKISKSDSFEELENIILQMNDLYKRKGEYESIISQINEVEGIIKNLDQKIDKIDNYLFSEEFQLSLKTQVNKFNGYFSRVSQELYGERYALSYEIKTDKSGQKYYQFNAFNANLSSGKKQGEILCFDLAYLLFADNEKIPCLHFLLNDKKELMHDNQLKKIAGFAKSNNIQLVISILKDKLPETVVDNAHVILELSQSDKLFRIE